MARQKQAVTIPANRHNALEGRTDFGTTPRSPVAPPANRQISLEEKIRARAYQLYCESGYQEGHEIEHWLEAERQILGCRNTKPQQLAEQPA